MLQVVDIRKDYRVGPTQVHVLRGISLAVEDGEMLAIVGTSGSGKTTLMNVLGLLDRPTSGSYTIDGDLVSYEDDRALSRIRNRKIGFVFQQYHLLPRLSALANVGVPLLYRGMGAREIHERSMTHLQKVEMGGRAHHRPSELSGGQQQRVAIARALANRPSVLLCDEPTGNLDLATGEGILEVLRKLNVEQGVTIICATHDHRMLNICDRLMWIRDGRVERVARRDEVHVEVGSIGGSATETAGGG